MEAAVKRSTDQPPPTTRSPLAASGYSWTILAVITVSQTLASWVGLSILPLAPFVQDEYGLSRAQLGLLISALYLGALVSSLPAGWLTDAIGSRGMLVLSLVVIGSGVMLVSQAGTFAHALAVMPVVGLGYGGINPMSSKAIMGWFPGRLRATAMGVKQTGFALGGALGALTLPSIALNLGWRAAVLFAGLAIVVWAVAGAWLYRDPPTSVARPYTGSGLWGTYGQLVRNRDLMLVVAVGLPLAATQLVVSGYLVLFLAEAVRLPVVLAAAMLSVAQMSGVAGRIGWAAATDRLGGRRRPVLLAITTLTAVALALVSLLGPASPLWVVVVVAVFLGATAVGWNGVYATLVGEQAGAGSIAGATALSTAANFLGVMLGPPLFGLAVDVSGSYALGWYLVILLSVGTAGLLFLTREYPGR